MQINRRATKNERERVKRVVSYTIRGTNKNCIQFSARIVTLSKNAKTLKETPLTREHTEVSDVDLNELAPMFLL